MALFAWQIEKYLAITHQTKLQAEISKMGLIIEADSLGEFEMHKYAYLHDTEDRTKPLDVEKESVNFNPITTLSTLFVSNYFTPSATGEKDCYYFIYFPPGEAKKSLPNYLESDPGYIIAAWSKMDQAPMVTASPGLSQWAQNNLTAADFQCETQNLKPNVLATNKSGETHDLPGINFQFKASYYSKVKL